MFSSPDIYCHIQNQTLILYHLLLYIPVDNKKKKKKKDKSTSVISIWAAVLSPASSHTCYIIMNCPTVTILLAYYLIAVITEKRETVPLGVSRHSVCWVHGVLMRTLIHLI